MLSNIYFNDDIHVQNVCLISIRNDDK